MAFMGGGDDAEDGACLPHARLHRSAGALTQQQTATRLAGLATVTGELSAAADVPAVTQIITRHAAQVIGAKSSLLAVVTEGTLTVLGHRGPRPEAPRTWTEFLDDESGPVAEVVRTRAPVLLLGRDEVAGRFPRLDNGNERSLVCIPLEAPGNAVLGVMALFFEDTRGRPDSQELQLLDVVADTCAQAMVRIEAQRESADRATKLEFLASASALLASSLDYRTTLSQVAALAVPTLSDWCAVDVVEDGHLRTLAVAHVDPRKLAVAELLRARYPTDPDAPFGVPNVARTGVSELFTDITDDMLVATAKDPEHLRITRELLLHSAIIVPLTVRSRVLGTITLVAAESGRRYTPADVTFAEEVAKRAALAIDNADLHSQTRYAAQELQRVLLPRRLPDAPGWRLAAVYRQAGRTEVGGDFYDVMVLECGRVAVFIGDVMGRGVDAAGAGVQIRSAVRAYVAQDPHPERVAEALDRLMAHDPLTPLATVAYALFDPHAETVEAVVAGHLPPLIISADGSSRFLTQGGSPPFGVGPMPRPSAQSPFGTGDTMLLFTDGLVERRDEDIDTSLMRLQRDATELAHADLAGVLSTLADRVGDSERADDVAALAVKRTTEPVVSDTGACARSHRAATTG